MTTKSQILKTFGGRAPGRARPSPLRRQRGSRGRRRFHRRAGYRREPNRTRPQLWTAIEPARKPDRRPRRHTMEHPSAMGARMSRPEEQWRPPEPPNRPPRPGGPGGNGAPKPSSRPRWMPWIIVAVLVTLVLVWQAAPGGGGSQAERRLLALPRPRRAGPRRRDQLRELEREDHRRVQGRLRSRRPERVHDAGPTRRAARPGRRHAHRAQRRPQLQARTVELAELVPHLSVAVRPAWSGSSSG